MSALANLKLVAAKRPTQLSPVIQRRNKISMRIGEQIELAQAKLDGKLYAPTKQRTVKDEETGAVIGTQPLLPGALSQKIPGYFDEVYYAFNRMKEGKPAFMLQTVSKGHYKARSRISGEKSILPSEIPNDYNELIKAIEKAGKENK